MKKRLILLIIIFPGALKSQDIHFSQFSKSSFFLNSSLLGLQTNSHKITIQRRSQWKSVAIPFNTFTTAIERKGIFKNNSVGLQFLNDVAGDARFKTTGINIIYAKLFSMKKKGRLSLGVGFGVFKRQLSYDNLIFNNQEDHNNIGFWFPEINTGITHEQKISKRTTLTNGVSFFHLNKAKQSLIENDNVRLNPKSNFHSMIEYYVNQKIVIKPKIFFSKQNKQKETITAFDAEYFFTESTTLKSGIYYRWGDALICAFGAEIDQIELIISYDYNTSSLRKASNNKGGIELSLVYVWDVKPKQNRKIKKQKTNKPCPKYL